MDQKTEGNSRSPGDKILVALENGDVKITGTKSEGISGANIKVGLGVEVFINGRQIGERGEVFPGDKVEVRPIEEIIPDIVEVKISADELRAEARYTPGQKKTHLIQDHPFTDDMLIEGSPRQEKQVTLSLGDLLKAIKDERVVYGLDESVIPRLIDEPETWHTVAEGLNVKQGKNGWVEPLFKGGVKSVSYSEDESKVDFRTRYEIEQVDQGDIIAIIHSPVPGEEGKKVTGVEIYPDPVSRVEVNCENGTRLSEDEKQVIATRKGVPMYKKGRTHLLRVDDIYTHKGDVDIKSGNIDFRGHFKIMGDVTEGMKVSADGDIEIGGSSSGAELLAGGSIVLKGNCIKCKVQAGWVDLVLKDIYIDLEEMHASVENALHASEEIAKALEAKGKHSEQMEAAVVRSLLQSKFTELPEFAAKLMKSIKSAGRSLPKDFVQTINDIAPYFIDFQYSQSLSRPVLASIKEKLSKLLEEKQVTVEKADITAPYVQNSVFLATGDINIPGPGVYNSNLTAKGEIRVARLFRGGSIESGGDVYIGEAGTPRITSDQGTIKVPYNGRVHLGTVYENIRIKFGNTEYRCDKNMSNVRIILDQQEFEVKVLHWDQ